jgi:hypothetical protein
MVDIQKFLQGIQLSASKELQDLKIMRKLDGLARTSVGQRELWNVEVEILKLFVKPE